MMRRIIGRHSVSGILFTALFFAGIIFGATPRFALNNSNLANSKVTTTMPSMDAPQVGTYGYTGTAGGLVTIDPWGMCVNGSPNILYCTFPQAGEVNGYYSNGSPCYYAGCSGSGIGQLSSPFGVFANATGYVYVADTYNNRIQVFGPDGSFFRVWGAHGYGGGYFVYPNAVAQNGTGYIYVLDSGNDLVQVFNPVGNYVSQWGVASNPRAMAINASGYVYVANVTTIQVFNQTGQLVSSFGGFGEGSGEFVDIRGLAFNSTGGVFVVDRSLDTVQSFSASGQYVFGWGAQGSGTGQLDGPIGIGLNSSDSVFIADNRNDRIQVFTQSGQFVSTWGSNGLSLGCVWSPSAVALNSSGYAFVTESRNDRVQVFTPGGRPVTSWGSYGTGLGNFIDPLGIAVNSSGFVYVADSSNARIQVFDSSGDFVKSWGTLGSDPGDLANPSAIAINSSGNVYVADDGNNRIDVFSPAGNFLCCWGSPGSEPGNFSGPSGIAVNDSGYIYVSDTSNNRIQVFNQAGAFIQAWGTQGLNLGQFNFPQGLCINDSGAVFVADSSNNRVQLFNMTGTPLGLLSPGEGGAPSQLDYPEGVGVNGSTGHVWVADTGNNRLEVFGNSPPIVSNVAITPASPTSSDNLVLAWNCYDPDGDEVGSVSIQWYKNNVVQSYLANLTVVQYRWLNRTEQWNASVVVTDPWGASSIISWSENVTIANSLPFALNLQVLPLNANATVPLTLSYTYFDQDNDPEMGRQILWYKNGGIQVQFLDSLSIPAGWTNKSDIWNVTLRLFDGYGLSYQWVAINIADAPPVVGNLSIDPVYPNKTSDLTLKYDYFDYDGDPAGQSLVSWYVNGAHAPQFDNWTGIPAAFLNRSQQWYAIVEGFDGFLLSSPVQSQTVVIGALPAQLLSAWLSPSVAYTCDSINLNCTYYDSDGDAATFSGVQWYKDSVLEPAFNGARVIPSSALTAGDIWYATFYLYDGQVYSPNYFSPSITVQAVQIPVISSPSNLTYYLGSIGNTLVWHVSDSTTRNATYAVFVDGVLISTGLSWGSTNPSVISVSVDQLSLGNHNVTLVVDNGLGIVTISTVFVTVAINPVIIIGVSVGIIAACIVLWLILVRRRRSSTTRGSTDFPAADTGSQSGILSPEKQQEVSDEPD